MDFKIHFGLTIIIKASKQGTLESDLLSKLMENLRHLVTESTENLKGKDEKSPFWNDYYKTLCRSLVVEL